MVIAGSFKEKGKRKTGGNSKRINKIKSMESGPVDPLHIS
jgi:hypothetical protein